MLILDGPLPLREILTPIPPADCGGVSSFVGWVRNHHEGRRVRRLFYDCYRPLAEKTLADILEETRRDLGLSHVLALHRVGWLEVGEAAVVVSAAAAHRDRAFEACRMLIERIKSEVPIWKKEEMKDGSSLWVSCAHPRHPDPHSATFP